MSTKARTSKPAARRADKKAAPKAPAARAKAANTKGRKKDTGKLVGRFALDFAAVRSDHLTRAGMAMAPAAVPMAGAAAEDNPALMRLQALAARDASVPVAPAAAPMAPVDAARAANWTPMGPLAVPNGQTYGGARVLISGRVTVIAPHLTDANTIFIGTSRGGVWCTRDGGTTWAALGDDQPSLAIGALGIGTNNPDVLYAGIGEGNVQPYSTAYPLSSAPGVYLGVGVLRSTDGGAPTERTQYATLHDAWEEIINPLSGQNPVAEHHAWHGTHGAGGGMGLERAAHAQRWAASARPCQTIGGPNDEHI